MDRFRNGHIENATLEDIFPIILDHEVFPDEGELQTISGFYRHELTSLRDSYKRPEVAVLIDPNRLKRQLANILVGYPHHRADLIGDRYGFDVSERD